MLKPDNLKELVVKYITDTITEEEEVTLQKWLQIPQNQEYFKNAVRDGHLLDASYSSIDLDNASQKLYDALGVDKEPLRISFKTFYRYAAVFLLLMALSFGGYSLYKSNTIGEFNEMAGKSSHITLEYEDGTLQVLNESTTQNILDPSGKLVAKKEHGRLDYTASNNNNAINSVLIKVPYGKRFEVKLADGSIVLLNAGSELSYPQSFTGLDSRDVYLKGEALFNVEHNPNQAFFVHTDHMNVKVYGTKFNVSSYQNDDFTSAVLTEGSISVYDPSGSAESQEYTFIRPGQQVIAQKSGFKVQEVDTEKHTAWSVNKLYFMNDRFGDIIKKLERYYGVPIKNKTPYLDDIRYTGVFTTETLVQVLNTFKENTNFEFRSENDILIIEAASLK